MVFKVYDSNIVPSFNCERDNTAIQLFVIGNSFSIIRTASLPGELPLQAVSRIMFIAIINKKIVFFILLAPRIYNCNNEHMRSILMMLIIFG